MAPLLVEVKAPFVVFIFYFDLIFRQFNFHNMHEWLNSFHLSEEKNFHNKNLKQEWPFACRPRISHLLYFLLLWLAQLALFWALIQGWIFSSFAVCYQWWPTVIYLNFRRVSMKGPDTPCLHEDSLFLFVRPVHCKLISGVVPKVRSLMCRSSPELSWHENPCKLFFLALHWTWAVEARRSWYVCLIPLWFISCTFADHPSCRRSLCTGLICPLTELLSRSAPPSSKLPHGNNLNVFPVTSVVTEKKNWRWRILFPTNRHWAKTNSVAACSCGPKASLRQRTKRQPGEQQNGYGSTHLLCPWVLKFLASFLHTDIRANSC